MLNKRCYHILRKGVTVSLDSNKSLTEINKLEIAVVFFEKTTSKQLSILQFMMYNVQ